ncbi:MAG TPA: YbfB/YjiJ family MFS transporter [Stellaceae bacterium]|nr:YbfB/YjiJ family MFS transporter [Stellaceae bacterium]
MALCVAYGLNAVGVVPHMVLLADFVARGLGHGVAAGAQCWVLFGPGAMVGPLIDGRVGDRIGFAAAPKRWRVRPVSSPRQRHSGRNRRERLSARHAGMRAA